MAPRITLVLGLCAALLAGAGTEPKPEAAAYPAHTKLESLSIAAQCLVRSFHGSGETFFLPDYLVIEVALYPAAGTEMAVNSGNFSLRVNNKRTALMSQTPGLVAASLKYPDWRRRPTLVAGAGDGDAGVILGQPQPVERFPGDTRPARTRLPRPPSAPPPANPSGTEAPERPKAEDVVVETALPEGTRSGPVSGYLYFPFRGKPKSIRSLELLYDGPAGPARLRLR